MQVALLQRIAPLLVLALLSTIVGLLDAWNPGLLRYDRQALLHGELWRLLSAHLVHTEWPHWGMNMLGLALVVYLYGAKITAAVWTAACLVSALGVGIGLLALNPEFEICYGLSGVLHGLFAMGALQYIRLHEIEGWYLFVAVASKLGWEQFAGPLPGSQEIIQDPIIVDAHLYGAASGVLLGLLTPPRRVRVGR